jgi:hypothetical protein
VAHKKASMWKLQHESWSYDFSAQVPADFKRKGKSQTTRKGKKSCAIADAGDAVSVASSAGENKMVDVVGMDKLLSSEQPVMERKGKSRTTRKGKKSCAIADAGDAVSVVSSAGENKMVDVVGMDKLLSSEQPVMEQMSNAADAEHISNAEETSSNIPSSELLVEAKGAMLRDTVSMTSTCDRVIKSYVDNINMSAHVFFGYRFILCVGSTCDRVIKSYVDIINMSAHVCFGYRFILRVVDTAACVGHATILKSDTTSEICGGFQHLMLNTHVPP